MHDNTVNLHPLWFYAVAIVAFLQIMWVIFRHARFVSWTAKTAAIFQRWWLIHVEATFEYHGHYWLMYFKLHTNNINVIYISALHDTHSGYSLWSVGVLITINISGIPVLNRCNISTMFTLVSK